MFSESITNPVESFAPDDEPPLVRLRRAFRAHHHAEFLHSDDAKGFQGFDNMET